MEFAKGEIEIVDSSICTMHSADRVMIYFNLCFVSGNIVLDALPPLPVT